jgi:uncharacterized membrane protein
MRGRRRLQLAAIVVCIAAYAGLSHYGNTTLFGHRTALCTHLADKLHGPLNAQEVRYTRRVTAAWALFFLSITVATLGFFLLAPLRIWSLFANFCVLPLIGLMFAAEYAIRLRVLPQVHRPGILAAVRVYFAGSH